jgi:hypothetical protein
VSQTEKPGAKNRTGRGSGLSLAVLIAMSLYGIIRVASGVNYVTGRSVSMVCRLFMVSGLMMLGGFHVVMRGMRKML